MTLHPYISKMVGRTKKVTQGVSIPGHSGISCNAHIRHRPRLEHVLPQKTPKMSFPRRMTPIWKNFEIVLKVFVITPIHVLCSGFMEIMCQDVGETHYFGDKNSAKCVFLVPFHTCLAEDAKHCRGACHVILHLPVTFYPNWFLFPGVIPQKSNFVQIQYMPSTYKNSIVMHRIHQPITQPTPD